MTIKLSKSDIGKFRQLLHADQHEMVADARLDSDSDTGPNPHDLYDAALAACKAITTTITTRCEVSNSSK